MGKKTTGYFIIGTFVTLYLLVSVISTIHVIDFFKLSNPDWLAISLAVAFEIGAAASLASIITLEKMNKGIVWGLFILLTLMQAMGNTYYAYTHLANFQGWIELFGLTEEDLIYQKRVLSIVSGAILPIVALGFIKSLVDYIKPTDEATQTESEDKIEAILEEKIEETIDNKVEELEEKIENLEEKMEEIVDGGDSNESEIIPENITEPVGEILESLNIGRYNTAVEVDPTKIN
ncbi:MAG: hypothetical protein EBW68_01950 [Actinobacteria bacterium]|nr:hypothetical protein [Actinomycetota bacterium]